MEHLFKIRDLSDNLLLCTQYCNDDTRLRRSDIRYEDRTYRAYVFREGGWKDGWSGVGSTSVWLHRSEIVPLLHRLGFDSCEVVRDWTASRLPRLTILARRLRR